MYRQRHARLVGEDHSTLVCMCVRANSYPVQQAHNFSNLLQPKWRHPGDRPRPAIDCHSSKPVQFRAAGEIIDYRQHLTLSLYPREERTESARRE